MARELTTQILKSGDMMLSTPAGNYAGCLYYSHQTNRGWRLEIATDPANPMERMNIPCPFDAEGIFRSLEAAKYVALGLHIERWGDKE